MRRRAMLRQEVDMDLIKAVGASGLLARWAWEWDMDEMEREALRVAPEDPHYLRLAWQPVALWGPALDRAALRKLRRAAMGRIDARDLAGEAAWGALGLNDKGLAAIKLSMAALDALSVPGRLSSLWAGSKASWANGGARPLAPIEKISSLSGLEWGCRAWRAASWSAIATMDWDDDLDEERAAAAWSEIERGEVGGAGGAGEGSVDGAERLRL